MLTPHDVLELSRVLDTAQLTEFTVETADYRIELRRGDASWTATSEVTREPVADAEPVEAPTSPVPEPGTAAAAGTAVPAPLPGTFYRAPEPGAQPFVEVGAVVAAESVIGIIETMKLMTPIAAGVDGVVTAIDVGDGEFVERSTPLIHVEQAS